MEASLVKFGDIAEFKNGINFNKDNFGTGIPVINVKDFQDYSYPKYEEIKEINPEGIVKKTNILQEGDVIFVRSNGNRELIGRTLLIKNLNKRKITHSAFTIRARFSSPKVNPIFYSYVFKSDLIRKSLSAQGVGTNISNLNQQILGDLLVPLPSLSMQNEVVEILEAYDNLIENNNRRITILEDMAQSLYHEWFVNFRFPSYQDCKFKESPIGLIPEGWEVAELGSVVDIQWGDTSTTKKSYVKEGYLAYSAAGADGKLDHYDFDRDGVVISAIGANCGITWFAMGKWSCIKNTIRFWAISDKVSTEYLYYATKSKAFWPKRGAAQPFISQGDAKKTKILIADDITNMKFTGFVISVLSQIEILSKKNIYLKNQRDLLLPKLISGKLKIN